MNQLPRTSTSILVRRKQSSASAGRQTTGSFSLKEVLSTIGTPVMPRKALDQLPVARVGLAIDGLQPARAVDVGDGRDQPALLLADLEDLHHERHVAVLLEPLGDVLLAGSTARTGGSSRAA